MVYVFFADGFEDIEAIAPVDIMRRADIDVKTVSITDTNIVTSAHGIKILTDTVYSNCNFSDAEALVLPGGMPGSLNLDKCEALRNMISEKYADNKLIAAICAAPMVFGHIGLLKNKRATIYPGMEENLIGAIPTGTIVEKDGNIITAKGPAAAMPFGYALVEAIIGENASEPLKDGMIFNNLMGL